MNTLSEFIRIKYKMNNKEVKYNFIQTKGTLVSLMYVKLINEYKK